VGTRISRSNHRLVFRRTHGPDGPLSLTARVFDRRSTAPGNAKGTRGWVPRCPARSGSSLIS